MAPGEKPGSAEAVAARTLVPGGACSKLDRVMDDYPTKIADFLESTAAQIRSLSVDRVRNAATWTAVGLVVGMLAFILVVFLVVGLFRLLAEITTVEIAYLILGGLFVIVGAFLWAKRTPPAAPGAGSMGEDTNA